MRAAIDEDADAIVLGIYNGNALAARRAPRRAAGTTGWTGTIYMGGILNQDTGGGLPDRRAPRARPARHPLHRAAGGPGAEPREPDAGMRPRLLVIGAGDLGGRIVRGMAASRTVGEIVLAGRDPIRSAEIVGVAASWADCICRFERVDATRQDQLEQLLETTRPDVVVQCASLLSPWALGPRDDAVADAIRAAGLAVALPMQLPIIHATMRAARAVGFAGPIANLSFPDLTNVILGRLGLAPTVGLGNASMIALRVRAALRAERGADTPLPLVRVVAHHAQLFPVMAAEPPDPAERVRVFLGEDGERHDALAYVGYPLPRGSVLNEVTAPAALETILALLPGAPPARLSVPAPLGLPGGLPVRIADRAVELDLPTGQPLDDAVRFNELMGRGDGVESIEADGTVVFTAEAVAAVADVAPWLAEPLAPGEAPERAGRLRDLLDAAR